VLEALDCFKTASKFNPLHEQAVSNTVKVLNFLNQRDNEFVAELAAAKIEQKKIRRLLTEQSL
jgi:hypothetical protein